MFRYVKEVTVTTLVTVGVAAVMVCRVTPTHEQADTYAFGAVQADAYLGDSVGVTVTCRPSSGGVPCRKSRASCWAYHRLDGSTWTVVVRLSVAVTFRAVVVDVMTVL